MGYSSVAPADNATLKRQCCATRSNTHCTLTQCKLLFSMHFTTYCEVKAAITVRGWGKPTGNIERFRMHARAQITANCTFRGKPPHLHDTQHPKKQQSCVHCITADSLTSHLEEQVSFRICSQGCRQERSPIFAMFRARACVQVLAVAERQSIDRCPCCRPTSFGFVLLSSARALESRVLEGALNAIALQ